MDYTLESLFGVAGKNIAVAGGTSGIGLELASALRQLGAHVAVLGVGEQATQAALARLEGISAPGRVLAFTADVTNEAQIRDVFDSIHSSFGRIDGLINSAGINRIEALHSGSIDNFSRVMDVNLKGMVICCKYAGRYMLRQNFGRVVNISSLSSIRGKSFYTAYASSKAAVNGFTRALAVEWAKNNITVNAIAPGMIVTDINRKQVEANPDSFLKRIESIPRGCAGKEQWLVAPVVMLLSDGAPHLTGQSIFCDGGSSIGDTFIMEKEKQGPLKLDEE